MAFIVLIVGAVVMLVAMTGVILPATLRNVAEYLVLGNRLYYAALARVAIGVVLIFAAPATRLPDLGTGLGVFFVVAGAGILMIGIPRSIRFTYWWLGRPDFLLRLGSAAGVALGALILWLGWPVETP